MRINNRCELTGYINYPKVSATTTGKTKFTANISVYRGKNNDQNIYDYIRIEAYDDLATNLSQIGNNQEVKVMGQLRHQKYVNNGETKYYDFVIVDEVYVSTRYVASETPVYVEDVPTQTTEPTTIYYNEYGESEELPF